MRFSVLLPALILCACGATWAQSPTYGVGRTPTPEEIRAEDITISPDGKNLPPGKGTAKRGRGDLRPEMRDVPRREGFGRTCSDVDQARNACEELDAMP